MDLKKTLPSIVNNIASHLSNRGQVQYLYMAYKLSFDIKEQAFALGIWKKWLYETDIKQAEGIRLEIKYMSDYFIKNNGIIG
jgi:hypothetical protein